MKKDLLSYFNIVLLSAAAFVATGCSEKDEPEPPKEPGLRTVLVYQVANNNLGSSGYDRMDLAEMKEAALAGRIPENSHLLVYNAGYNRTPVLIELNKNGLDTLKEYSRDVYSVQSERMLEVLSDAQTLAGPTKEFGIVLWSHGSGWLQDGIADPADNISTKSFGSENGRTMNISTLANVLSKGPKLSFVYFDCCYMASVETLYQLRDVAPVIAASATELLVYGMPYDKNVQCFFAETPDIEQAARNTFELYDAQSGSDRTCTMSVTRTAGLDNLAKTTAAIYERAPQPYPADYTPQRFMNKGIVNCNYFDFGNYVEALCLDNAGEERFEGAKALLDDFHKALEGCVTYAAATPKLWNTVPLTYHCGLSTYILMNDAYHRNQNYYTLGWYADVASKLKF